MREKTRVCRKCGEEKNIDEFKFSGKHGEKRYRLRACKDCNWYPPPPKMPLTYEKGRMACVCDPSRMYTNGSIVKGQFQQTLDAGMLPPGSKWIDNATTREFIIEGNEHWHNIVECVKKPDEQYLKAVREKQRMVRCGP